MWETRKITICWFQCINIPILNLFILSQRCEVLYFPNREPDFFGVLQFVISRYICLCTFDLSCDACRPGTLRIFSQFARWVIELDHGTMSWTTFFTTRMLCPVISILKNPTAICSINWISTAWIFREFFTRSTALSDWILILSKIDVVAPDNKFVTIWTAGNIVQVGSLHFLREFHQISASGLNKDEVSWNTTILSEIPNGQFYNVSVFTQASGNWFI